MFNLSIELCWLRMLERLFSEASTDSIVCQLSGVANTRARVLQLTLQNVRCNC